MNKVHVPHPRYRAQFQRIIHREFRLNNSNVLLRFRTVEKIRANCCRINRVQRSSRAKNKMKLASGENGSSNRRKLDAKSGRVKLLTMIRLETCVLHRWRDKESERLRKKISRLLNNFEFTRQICKNFPRVGEETCRFIYLSAVFFYFPH